MSKDFAYESLPQKSPDQKFCVECGSVIKQKAEICPKCGVRQVAGEFSGEGKSRVVAAVLAIILGGFGIHKFYLGKIGMGIIYLLFFWTCIPGLVGLIEGIIYITSSEADFQRKYGNK